MTRLEQVRAAAEKHGLTLTEFLVLDAMTLITATPAYAAELVAKILRQSSAQENCQAAVWSCIENGWLRMSPNGMLALTGEGVAVKQKISGEVVQFPDGGSTARPRRDVP